MKFFTALLATETNTFVTAPTGWGSFNEYGIFRGDASTRDAKGVGVLHAELRKSLEAEGHEMVESLLAFAQPLGKTVREVYESLRDEVLEDLKKAGPVDGVILILHGAMVAEGYDDCEGDIISRARAIVGPDVTIGVELDLHCHFTHQMMSEADVIVGYKEYPHTDGVERLLELARIVIDTAQGKVRPVTAVHDCRMVGLWHTTREPMAGFVRRMQECEKQPGVLSVSLGHGFPWADVPEAGAKLWVVTDNNLALAESLADELGKEFWDLRHATEVISPGVEEVLDQALAVEGGPVVIADMCDNPGGGATGDSTFVLKAILERKIADVAIGGIWDLGAIHLCRDAGVGARFVLRIGGKCGVTSGDPVDLAVTVKAVVDNHTQHGLGPGTRAPLGLSVWVQADNGLDLVLISKRSQAFGTDLFTGLGMDLSSKKIIVVKSAQHFHAQFAPIAKQVFYVSTPAALSADYAALPYVVRDLDYWPRVEEPQRPSRAIMNARFLPAPGELHTVDGRQMHIVRSGPGPFDPALPTIVIEAGCGSLSALYGRLQAALATKYQVCTYDRVGMGWSESDDQPFDAQRNARQLHGLLAAAGVTGPIVLLGHSLGGLLARVYADLYPEQVAGVMMLDASHHDQFEVFDDVPVEMMAADRDSRAKFQAGGPPPATITQIQALFADMPHLVDQLIASYRPEGIDATIAEMKALRHVARQAGASAKLGDRPVSVLWAQPQPQPLPPGMEGVAEVQKRWPEYQKELAALSTRGREQVVPGAAHMTIMLLPPFVAQVAQAVDELMAEI